MLSGYIGDMNTTSSLDDLHAEMQCFVLPYGGIGFALNLLAAWGFFFLTDRQSPWCGEKLKHRSLNVYFSLIGMCGSFAITGYQAHRCRSFGPLLFAALCTGSRVTILNFISVVWNYDEHNKTFGSGFLGFMFFTYFGFAIAGVWGVSQIARAGWDDGNMKIGTMSRPLPARRSLCS